MDIHGDRMVAAMAFQVKDEATDQAVRRLAQLRRKTLIGTIREAVEPGHGASAPRFL
jgi:hypothetical protein